MDRRKFLGVTVGGASLALGCSGGVQGTNPDASVAPDGAAPDGELADELGPALDAESSDAAADDAGGDAPIEPAEAGSDDVLAALGERSESFPYGIWAGDADSDSAVFATRYTGARGLELVVLELADGGVARVAHAEAVTPDADGYANVLVRGLRAGARHRYAFVERDGAVRASRSPEGRLRAALGDGETGTVRFLATSCTKQAYRPFASLGRALTTDDVDFTVHAGDHVYCDGATTLQQYRAKYAENWPDPTLAGWHRVGGAYNTWDDHEVENNFDIETANPAQVAAARRAFFEHNPVRRAEGAPDRIYRSYRWGRALELFVLDCRGEQRKSTRRSSAPEYVSPAQMEWLRRGLTASAATFKVVVTSLPISNLPLVFQLGVDTRWEGYAAQRAELLDHVVGNNIRGVLFVAGDHHFGAVAKVDTSGPHAVLREVLVGPGGQLGNPLASTLRGDQWELATTANSYTEFVADPAARTIEVAFYAARGELIGRRTLAFA